MKPSARRWVQPSRQLTGHRTLEADGTAQLRAGLPTPPEVAKVHLDVGRRSRQRLLGNQASPADLDQARVGGSSDDLQLLRGCPQEETRGDDEYLRRLRRLDHPAAQCL